MEAGDAAERLLHAESDLRYAMAGGGEPGGILQKRTAGDSVGCRPRLIVAVVARRIRRGLDRAAAGRTWPLGI